MTKITGSCELHASATSMVALLPVNAAGRARAATTLLLLPLLAMLVPSAAGLAACDRRLRAKPGVERPLEGSWSDGGIIRGLAPCLLDGFDPSGTLLLFSCRNRISGCFTPIRGARGLAVLSPAPGRVGCGR